MATTGLHEGQQLQPGSRTTIRDLAKAEEEAGVVDQQTIASAAESGLRETQRDAGDAVPHATSEGWLGPGSDPAEGRR
jgi:hypothetical protein